ncbi:MAG: hypothetical protein IT317_20555 [Anaerolineales bacterium]|nr:hypothetical protein [Anaerolineales bacterium]
MLRHRKFRLALIAALAATLALAPLVALPYKLRTYNITAGGAGGASMTSANYRLESSAGGAVLIQAGSASYRLCSGFLCDAQFIMGLPLTTR